MTNVVYRSDEASRQVEAQYRQVLDQWPVSKSEMRVPTRQGTTFVVVCGPEDAPPVVLFHGSQANSAAWIPDIRLWSSKFRLFAVDMIGEPGLSENVRPELAGDAHALWLDDVFEGLGIETASLIGTSLGGWLALDYASRRRSAVQALALICPAGIGRQKNFLLKAAPLLLLGSWGEHKFRELIFGPAPAEFPDELRPMADLMDTIGRVVKPRVLKIPRMTDEQLRQLDMPILAVLGGKDALLDSRETRDRLRSAAPHAEICFVEGGYHYLPNQSVQIMEFLQRNIPTAGA
jgi:pimeloyl-ACP methyl ester carboxylesterase